MAHYKKHNEMEMCIPTASDWYKYFKHGQELWEENHHSSYPSTALMKNQCTQLLSSFKIMIKCMISGRRYSNIHRRTFQNFDRKFCHTACLHKFRSTTAHSWTRR